MQVLLEIGDDATELITELRARLLLGPASLSCLDGITNGATPRASCQRMVAQPCFRSS
jgi:hypothetical protein